MQIPEALGWVRRSKTASAPVNNQLKTMVKLEYIYVAKS